jgi:hypothetical protein
MMIQILGLNEYPVRMEEEFQENRKILVHFLELNHID